MPRPGIAQLITHLQGLQIANDLHRCDLWQHMLCCVGVVSDICKLLLICLRDLCRWNSIECQSARYWSLKQLSCTYRCWRSLKRVAQQHWLRKPDQMNHGAACRISWFLQHPPGEQSLHLPATPKRRTMTLVTTGARAACPRLLRGVQCCTKSSILWRIYLMTQGMSIIHICPAQAPAGLLYNVSTFY